jgi:hypothetical protein
MEGASPVSAYCQDTTWMFHITGLPCLASKVAFFQQCPQKGSSIRVTICKSTALENTANEPDRASMPLTGIPRQLNAFYQFTRPHTMLGTFLSVFSVSLLALVRPHTHFVGYNNIFMFRVLVLDVQPLLQGFQI